MQPNPKPSLGNQKVVQIFLEVLFSRICTDVSALKQEISKTGDEIGERQAFVFANERLICECWVRGDSICIEVMDLHGLPSPETLSFLLERINGHTAASFPIPTLDPQRHRLRFIRVVPIQEANPEQAQEVADEFLEIAAVIQNGPPSFAGFPNHPEPGSPSISF